MQKKGFFRLLTVSIALVLVISACCLTVLGYEGVITPHYGNVVSEETAGETTSPSTEEPQEPVSTPTPATPTPEPATPTPEPATPTPEPATPTPAPDQGTGGGNTSSYDEPDYTYSEPAYEEPSYDPDYGNSVSEPDYSVPAGSNFNDDDNSDLVDDGSVVSGLPAGEASDSSEESSSESEESSQPESTGNGGSSILLIAGIVLIVLGVGGLGTVVYLQFIRPKMKAKKAEADSSPFVEDDIDGYNVTPEQPQVDTKADTMEIDINSYDAGKDDEVK